MKQILIILLLCIVSRTLNAQVTEGQSAPAITLPNTKDSLITLSSFKGKVVLLDFWASWCPPCRAANPGNVKLYNKYKHQGFVILGLSIDQNKTSWLKAIKKDRITYPQIIDDKGWEALTAIKYGINQIPLTFLIDKKGIIRAIDPTKADLLKMIQQLLKE